MVVPVQKKEGKAKIFVGEAQFEPTKMKARSYCWGQYKET